MVFPYKLLHMKHKEIIINDKIDLREVQNYLQELNENVKLPDKKIHELLIIASELANNILKHSGKGKIGINHHSYEDPYIEIISENIGKLPYNAINDGFSTEDSLGIGLGAVCRLSDKVFYEQSGNILRIGAIKYCTKFKSKTEVGVLSYPTLGNEKSNGDTFLILRNKDDLLCVIDALGHGEDAHESAIAAKNFIENNHKFSIDRIILGVHNLLKSSFELRGVMISIIRIDYKSNKIFFCGIGDVLTKIFLPKEEGKLYALPKDGIVGDQLQAYTVQEFDIIKGAIIAMFTDGISSKLNIPLSMRSERPARLVHDLMKKYGKSHDDRTLLLAKISD